MRSQLNWAINRACGAGSMLSHRVPLVVEFGRFGEVHLVPPEVVQRSLHEETEVLVILDQPVPQGMLREEGGRREKWKRGREREREREREEEEEERKGEEREAEKRG